MMIMYHVILKITKDLFKVRLPKRVDSAEWCGSKPNHIES